LSDVGQKEPEEIEVTDELVDRVKTWFSSHASDVPEDVRLVVGALLHSHGMFKELLKKNKALRNLVSTYMGKTPKSERSGQSQPKPKSDKVKPNEEKACDHSRRTRSDRYQVQHDLQNCSNPNGARSCDRKNGDSKIRRSARRIPLHLWYDFVDGLFARTVFFADASP
jgi:hypothetical protein